jgi:hypothetical protein
VVPARRSSTAVEGRCLAVVEHMSRKVECRSRADHMASLVTRSNSDVFLSVETPEGARLCSPYHDYLRSHGKT